MNNVNTQQMKKSNFTRTMLMSGFLIGTFFFISCNGKPKQQAGHDATKKDSTQVVYACSMHPEVTGKEGDKCSKCGMNLEAVKK
jgi:hypothetical protein